MDNPNDVLSPSGETVKYSQWPVGQKIQGVVIAVPKLYPDNDFKTKEQKRTLKGALKWTLKITIDTGDGVKTLFLSGRAYWSAIEAIKKAGLRTFEQVEGATFAMMRTEDGEPPEPGFAAPKNYPVIVKAPQD